MSWFGDFHFIRPLWLGLAPLVVGLWWLRRKAQDPLRGWRAVMDAELLKSLAVGEDDARRWRGAGLLAGWLLAVLAVAGPTWRPEPSPFADDPVPVMLVLRAGETMELSDLAPSRMERARLKIADFASARRGQPLGLIAYAGSAHLVLPPTRDTSVVATMAAEVSPAIMPEPGDDLVGAFQLAERTLGGGGGSIVVLADTVSAALDQALSEFHTRSKLRIHLLAVARADTPESEALQAAASTLGAKLTALTPGPEDVESLARSTAQAPLAVGAAGESTRWAEAGWWLVPVIAVSVLTAFRRQHSAGPEEATA